MNAIEVKQMSYSYGGPYTLEDVSFDIASGTFCGVIGPNGGGKSSLINILLGYLQPQQGSVHLFGKNPVRTRKWVGYVPQFVTFDLSMPITVGRMVTMGRLEKSIRRIYSREDVNKAKRLMASLGLEGMWESKLSDLSGGQLQKCLLARALVSEPKMLILDEPTASIDPSGETTIFDLLSQLKGEITIILVSHDYAYISKFTDKVICVNRKVSHHKSKALSSKDLHELYGHGITEISHHHPGI